MSVKDLKKIYSERSKLYYFLSSKRIILNPASPLPNTLRKFILRPYECRKWSITPEKLKEVTDYLSSIKIQVITIREGLKRYYVS